MASVSAVFKQIEDNLKADPSLVSKVGGVFQFKIDDATWTVDAKNAPGSVTNGAAGSPDVTITVKGEDFLAMAAGTLNGQTAFMQGKLKLAGNMALAMKLGVIMEKKQGGAAAADSDSISLVFTEIHNNIKQDPSLVQKVNGVYGFDITRTDGSVDSWIVDLKNGAGDVKHEQGKADCSLSLSEETFIDMMTGNLDGQAAFMQGKLKMKGNMALAMKLGQVMDAKGPKSKL
eukprot:CAMPEP_0174260956 /NCGR_PEP_ID=MMETSP0439-20130205/11101_1 /TAXON_ID=0 /ORGANISM="Stereomyxa ramosa, Strain Chinc5" /LENGTH=230 /DNA_ID=CAMNT_0015345349 /DNA_START=34 /DNA_END=726 /DNA_ORIENTATION=-